MFPILGRLVSRSWPLWLVVWGPLLVGTWWAAPRWQTVAREGEFNFMPRDVASEQGERLRHAAFPGDRSESTVVVVLQREDDPNGLRDEDRRFISQRLEPALHRLKAETQGHGGKDRQPAIARVRTLNDREAGPLLVSQDHKASLVVLDLNTDFLIRTNIALVNRIHEVVRQLEREGAVPPGLEIDFTGSAMLGRDMMAAESTSARAIERWTIGIVIVMLLAFYRAPLLALTPMLCLFVAVKVALHILMLLARAGYVELFRGLDVYITVVAYAAGVDYNLFLISRYEERLAAGSDIPTAVAEGLGRIGGALAASAATVICGIGTLLFASFGKFRDAGLGIAFSLLVMLLAILTLTPSLLRLFGRWAVWPRSLAATDSSAPRLCGWAARMLSRVDLFGGLWEKVGQIVERRPATVWLATVAALAPLAAFCARHYNDVNYGLIQELSKRELSVRGTLALARHYPEGASGPLTVLLRNDHVDFSQSDGLDLVGDLVGRLKAERSALHIADLRSVVDPLGITPAGQAALPQGVTAVLERPLVLGRAIQHYVSDTQVVGRHVTRLDMILDLDPFTRRSIHHLDKLESAIHNALPTADRRDTEIRIIGATASFRDLEVVGQRDRTRISLYVTGSVLLVLVLLLRRLAIPIYLILSVLFGYFVTLGATHAFFRLLEGSSFVGLDWTVPIFLFTLLIAIGEDYNIILVTRVDEEQAHHGPVGGVTAALARTGGTISGCGVIMAGTFASLAFGGALARMYQLGFALTFGVLLDTFVIRPILVPAYLVFVNSGRLGALGRYLGGKTAIPRSPTVGAMP